MKKKICLLLTAIFITSNIPVFADQPIRATINGIEINFDQPPVIEAGRTLVPVRAITEALGAEVHYDEPTKSLFITNEDTIIFIMLDSKTAMVNGVEKTLDVPAKAVNGRTLLPIRFISEALNLNVEWNDSDKIIYLSSKAEDLQEPEHQTDNLDSRAFSQITNILNESKANPSENSETTVYYKEYPTLPDFGAYASLSPLEVYIPELKDGIIYTYPYLKIAGETIITYSELLLDNGFDFIYTDEDNTTYFEKEPLIVGIGINAPTLEFNVIVYDASASSETGE